MSNYHSIASNLKLHYPMLTANDLSKLYSQNLTLIPDLRYSISGLKIQQFHTNGFMHEFS